MRTITTAILIFLFWFVLSGHTETLLIGLGIASTLVSVYLANRMRIISGESYPFHLSFRLLTYYVYLAKEIVIANYDVVKRVIRPSTINPKIIHLPANQQTSLGKVIYANSITLTPGTVTLELNDDEVVVHALSDSGAEDLQAGTMANSVPDDEESAS